MSGEATTESNWVNELKVSQLKQILRARSVDLDEERGCSERSELENLAMTNIGSLGEAQEIMNQSKHSAANSSSKKEIDSNRYSTIMAQLKQVLSDDRDVLIYYNYTPSKEHLERIQQAKKELPIIFDNPDLMRRDNWVKHRNWRKNSQMPPFHVHFREEMQQSIRHIYQCLVSLSENKTSRAATSASQAYGAFRGCMSGLNGHVGIEEYAVFPQFQKKFPGVDINFLYQDHQKLHDKEAKTREALKALWDDLKGSAADEVSSDTVMDALQELLDFDQDLMAHLGEEEEFIVPMTLSTERLFY
jgi:hypothetical protein